jgi:hypothetical protein
MAEEKSRILASKARKEKTKNSLSSKNHKGKFYTIKIQVEGTSIQVSLWNPMKYLSSISPKKKNAFLFLL